MPKPTESEAIPLPARHHFDAAVGWMLLGLPADAALELDRLPQPVCRRAEVLELRWEVHSALGQWTEGYRTATQQVALYPDEVSGWLHRAYAARRMDGGGVAHASGLLVPAATRFPTEPLIRFNLACYAAVMGDLEGAWTWYCKALAVGNPVELRATALSDPDLESLWPRIAVGS